MSTYLRDRLLSLAAIALAWLLFSRSPLCRTKPARRRHDARWESFGEPTLPGWMLEKPPLWWKPYRDMGEWW